MKKLAEGIKLAAKYREESFDKEAFKKVLEKDELVDHRKFYKISLFEASEKAASDVGFNIKGILPIYLLLKYCWNDILDWAE